MGVVLRYNCIFHYDTCILITIVSTPVIHMDTIMIICLVTPLLKTHLSEMNNKYLALAHMHVCVRCTEVKFDYTTSNISWNEEDNYKYLYHPPQLHVRK